MVQGPGAGNPHPDGRLLNLGVEAVLRAAISVPVLEMLPKHDTQLTWESTSSWPWLPGEGER